ncbi:hypothetical protein ACEZCY_14450 [Streptacidiphilus sp. N1-12]|uniref:Uncharacterized protein n=2 Tax=Streptacidiphilus alkalitolerans TaxID=3342712 RepID=A0ABV6VA15_9ACTN
MNDNPTPVGPTAEFLDEAERQVYAAISLGRRLIANPHPDRPITDIKLDERPGGFGLRIWAKDGPDSVHAWAEVLGVAVHVHGSSSTVVPQNVHYNADGVLEGVPVYIWAIVRVPITAGAVVANEDGVRVVYVQGGAKHSAPMYSRTQAREWVSRHVARPTAVAA